MKKYQVLIARNETTIYTIEVDAISEYDAEKNAYKKWANGDYETEKVVYGEEDTHAIEEVINENKSNVFMPALSD
jgi:hypothetical protein